MAWRPWINHTGHNYLSDYMNGHNSNISSRTKKPEYDPSFKQTLSQKSCLPRWQTHIAADQHLNIKSYTKSTHHCMNHPPNSYSSTPGWITTNTIRTEGSHMAQLLSTPPILLLFRSRGNISSIGYRRKTTKYATGRHLRAVSSAAGVISSS